MPILQKISKKNKIIALAAFLTAIIIYLSFYVFFRSHFYFGTEINGVSVSGMTAEEADSELAAFASAYSLVLNERGDMTEQITGAELGLSMGAEGGSDALKQEQNKTCFVKSLFIRDSLKLGTGFNVDESLLKAAYSKLSCVDSAKVTEPQNAKIVYGGSGYEVVQEVYGNKASYDILYPAIKNAAANGIKELDLEGIKCYINPTITADSDKVKDTKKLLEKYITARITYNYEGGSEVVDAPEIVEWAELDGDLNIVLNQTEIKSFVNSLAPHYNTVGKARTFQTSTGNVIEVGGGDYGWKINASGEVAHLVEAIQNGTTEDRTPSYSQKGAVQGENDLGSTYVEINITAQHMWYYKNGSLVVEGDVVTGNVSKGNGTPGGIYKLKYKERNATLDGQDYSTPVAYWMPFNNNIGIHDATWRTEFGKDIYLTAGSHGCVNSPYELAQTIYENISAGVPVIVYY
ncbi:MAG: peptidoglycan transpeptidase precursor, ErfK-YbiS-YhnG family [Firmicutes bacterium]|nr:peptidoglycan transpeptidase precursor, ErfK-YbiS-YhnG family [Bacillota bacterium]